MTGIKIDFNKQIRAEFGEYVQVHEEHDNTMQAGTTGAIATKPTGNAQGGFWFYSLTTGRMLDRRQWTRLPVPQDVIERITVLARNNPAGMRFTNMQNEPVYDIDNDSDDDLDYDPDEEEDDDDDYDDFIAGVDAPNNNADPPDPPEENGNVDEHQQNEDDDDEQEDGEDNDGEVPTNHAENNNGNEEQEQAEAEEHTIISASLESWLTQMENYLKS